MDDIIKSVKAFLYERSSSPLLGAFIVSWCVWNYQSLIIVFSNSDFGKKIEALNEYFSIASLSIYSFDIPSSLVNGLIFPSILTILYIFIYPFVAEPVYEHALKKQKE